MKSVEWVIGNRGWDNPRLPCPFLIPNSPSPGVPKWTN
jgi:hypothetical protein